MSPLLRLGLAATLGLGGAPAGAGQAGGATRVLLVTGLSGEPRFATGFHAAASALYDAAQARWGVPDSSLIYLAEDPAQDPKRIRGRATRDNLAAAFQSLARAAAPGDVVLVVLIGHGSGEGAASRLSLPGPDPTAADFTGWLGLLRRATVVLVNAASGSGDFVGALADSGRVIVTATKTAFERNETTFAEPFARGLVSGAADADKDGRVTVLEAFQFARQEVARSYEARNVLLTEHAQLSDSALARSVAFGTQALPADPAIAALYAERRALEAQVAALRRRKGTLDSLAYERELERLLLDLAGKTAAIRAAEARKP
ncbi:MAG TPA: hypothetical protein VL241_00440 [Gemmatimonadales bacterium]|nr:hypothetical protein [Gemmatimonadales bacterium]